MTRTITLRRTFLMGAAAALTLPAAAWPQAAGLGRPGVRRGERPGVDESLRRTVRLVLRAEARTQPLPDFMIDPEPLPDDVAALLLPDGALPPDIPIAPVPDRVDRRLPHSRRGSIWVAAGTWMMEVDPVRRLIILIAHDVLPPDI
jgi:hypothetical protein